MRKDVTGDLGIFIFCFVFSRKSSGYCKRGKNKQNLNPKSRTNKILDNCKLPKKENIQTNIAKLFFDSLSLSLSLHPLKGLNMEEIRVAYF